MSKDQYTEEERKSLLKLARWAIADKMKRGPEKPGITESLKDSKCSGAFVTLRKGGNLRGCIGRFTSDDPVLPIIEEMAQAAAFEDPRFPSLKDKEFEQVDLEISVLSPMRRVENPEEIEVGRHGIYIINGHFRGVLLPQVATEQGWDRQTFLENTCLKAGMTSDCWKDPDTEIHVFSAEVFGEKNH